MSIKDNPFVLSKEQADEFRKNFGDISFQVQGIYVEFETTAKFVKEVTPDCYDVPKDPVMCAMVEQYQTFNGIRFGCSTVSVNTTYKGVDGAFSLRMYTDSEYANNAGREAWGEGKKFAYTHLYKCGTRAAGMLERNGRTLMEVSFDELKKEEPQDIFEKDFEIKAVPSHIMTKDKAFAWPLQVLTIDAVTHCKVISSGTGTVKMLGGELDHLDKIPVVDVIGATYLEGIADWSFGGCDIIEV